MECWHVSKHALQLDSFSKTQILWNNILSCGNKSMQKFLTIEYPRKKMEKKNPNSVILKENIFQKVNIIIFQEDFLKYDINICKLCVI
jgi:hypothetical protein